MNKEEVYEHEQRRRLVASLADTIKIVSWVHPNSLDDGQQWTRTCNLLIKSLWLALFPVVFEAIL